jgi:hypothetical protein
MTPPTVSIACTHFDVRSCRLEFSGQSG